MTVSTRVMVRNGGSGDSGGGEGGEMACWWCSRLVIYDYSGVESRDKGG